MSSISTTSTSIPGSIIPSSALASTVCCPILTIPTGDNRVVVFPLSPITGTSTTSNYHSTAKTAPSSVRTTSARPTRSNRSSSFSTTPRSATRRSSNQSSLYPIPRRSSLLRRRSTLRGRSSRFARTMARIGSAPGEPTNSA